MNLLIEVKTRNGNKLRAAGCDPRPAASIFEDGANIMPDGGNTALNDDDWKFVKADFDAACKHYMQSEWLQWFIGGLVENKLPVREASNAACIEWDF
jgi:hypothetical protein